MIKFLIILIFLTFSLFAITLDELKTIPKSIERDFFIWRFISDKKTTKAEAKEAIKLRHRLNSKLRKAYLKKTGIDLRAKKRRHVASKEQKKYQKLISSLHQTKNFYNAWLALKPYDQVKVFIYGGKHNRLLLNKSIPSSILESMSKYYAFNYLLYRVKREKLSNIYNAILNTKFPTNNKINYENLMQLGFYALKHNKKEAAKHFFKIASKKVDSRFNRDRNLFWRYMTTKDKALLEKLANSYEVNLYRLLALDLLNRPYPKPDPIPALTSKEVAINISDPIAWAKLKKKIFNKHTNLHALAKKYAHPQTLAFFSYIATKASHYEKQYFPVVYKELLKDFSTHRQALILALAKQESQLIPAAISHSFAIGLMQFMPFLIKDIAKRRNLTHIDIEDLFKPEHAIDFANFHLNFLEKYFYNPVLVAYAYNGGFGFTKKLVKNKNYFQKGEYEPYLSMELVKNRESNIYAKKVIANYVMYRQILGSPVKITDLLNELLSSKAHKF